MGSGLGARIRLDRLSAGRRDGFLFGEFIGSCLIEVPPKLELASLLTGVPYLDLGEVTEQPRLTLVDRNKVVWEETLAQLTKSWTETFREVLK